MALISLSNNAVELATALEAIQSQLGLLEDVRLYIAALTPALVA